MKSIINISQAIKLAKSLNQSNQKIVLVGGCFDIVHLGHLVFFKKARLSGDILFVLLESDKNIKKLKGNNRPINSQINRAKFLTYLKPVDFIVMLPEMKTDQDYSDLIIKIKPAIIAVTKNDPKLNSKTLQAQSVNAQILPVTDVVFQQSTSLIIKKCYNKRQSRL